MTNIQRQVQDAVDELVETGAERGLQVAVYVRGEQIVDAVAGVADPRTGRPIAPDTPGPPRRSAGSASWSRGRWRYNERSCPSTSTGKRVIESEEVADAVAFLLTPAGTAITGAPLVMDQGWTAR